jgi:hypothetical protein
MKARTTQSWKCPPGRLQVSRRGYERRTDESERRVLDKAVGHRAQSSWLQHEIGIAHQQQIPGGLAGTVVHTAPKAEVPPRVEELARLAWLRCKALKRVIS